MAGEVRLDAPTVGPTYRRRIEIDTTPRRVEAVMEDTHHHLRVTIDHDGEVVQRARAEGVRLPWATCAQGAAGVAMLEGRTLAEVTGDARWASDRSRTCVHAVDVAVLALAHAARPGHTRYEVRLRGEGGGRYHLVVRRDGREVLTWALEGDRIVGPEPFADLGLGIRGPQLLAWARATVDPAQVEVVSIARRASQVGRSRTMDLDDYPTAGDVMAPDGSCRTYQPDMAPLAVRLVGSSRATEAQPGADDDLVG